MSANSDDESVRLRFERDLAREVVDRQKRKLEQLTADLEEAQSTNERLTQELEFARTFHGSAFDGAARNQSKAPSTPAPSDAPPPRSSNVVPRGDEGIRTRGKALDKRPTVPGLRHVASGSPRGRTGSEPPSSR
jgi:hypothetical protein